MIPTNTRLKRTTILSILSRVNCISFPTYVRDISIKISGPISGGTRWIERGSIAWVSRDAWRCPPSSRGDSRRRRRRTTLHNTCPVVFVPLIILHRFSSPDHLACINYTQFFSFLGVPDFSFHGRREGKERGKGEIRLLTRTFDWSVDFSRFFWPLVWTIFREDREFCRFLTGRGLVYTIIRAVHFRFYGFW